MCLVVIKSACMLIEKSTPVATPKSLEWTLLLPQPPVKAEVTVILLLSIVTPLPATRDRVFTKLDSCVSKIPSLSSSKSQALFIPSPSGSFAVGVPTVAP